MISPEDVSVVGRQHYNGVGSSLVAGNNMQ